ncbi:MAG: AMP-binding protein [Candidatus Melainabacteria bacterium]|nr:AMP-binding protein [Candidatus Melainabacteria bacterium]
MIPNASVLNRLHSNRLHSAAAAAIGTHPGASPWNNVIAFLCQHASNQPHKHALLQVTADSLSAWHQDSHQSLVHEPTTYGQLWQQVLSTAQALRAVGIQPGDRLLVFVPMSVALYRVLFAVQLLGAAAVFLDSWSRAKHLSACAGQTTPVAVIAPEAYWSALQAQPGFESVCHWLPDTISAGMDSSTEELLTPVHAETTALITFTTGSSGQPKGANRTHRFLAAQHAALNRSLPYTATDLDLPVFPIFSLNNLAGGVSTVLPAIDLAKPAATDGALLAAQLLSTGANTATLSPSLLRAVSQWAHQAEVTLPSLRRVATGGAPVSTDDARAFFAAAPQSSLHILYGSTEVEPIAHLEITPKTLDQLAQTGATGVCVGPLVSGLASLRIRPYRGPVVLEASGWKPWLVANDDPGELLVSGEHVCDGYFNNPEAFQRAKVVDADGRVWHRTGDVVQIDEQNRLWLLGRVHNAIQRANQLLFPLQAELVLKRLPFVREAAYLGLPDEALGEKAVAVVTVRQECLPAELSHTAPLQDSGWIGQQVMEALQAHQIEVDAVYVEAQIPMDPRHHSKVEYDQLRQQLLAERSQ